MDVFALYLGQLIIAFLYFAYGGCVTVGNCDLEVYFNTEVDTNATNESGEKIAKPLSDVFVGAPIDCISDCCKSEFCTSVVYSMSRGRGTKNCFTYQCPNHKCPSISNVGAYLYDMTSKKDLTEPSTPKTTTRLTPTVLKTFKTPKISPSAITEPSTSKTTISLTPTVSKTFETLKITSSATTSVISKIQTTSLQTTRRSTKPAETPQTTPTIPTMPLASITPQITRLKTTRLSTKPVESAKTASSEISSTSVATTSQRASTNLTHPSTKSGEITIPDDTTLTTTRRIISTSLSSTSPRMTTSNPTIETKPRETTTTTIASASLVSTSTRRTILQTQPPTIKSTTYIKPTTVRTVATSKSSQSTEKIDNSDSIYHEKNEQIILSAEATATSFDESSESAKNRTLADTPRLFHDSYGILITFVVFGFMILITTIYVVSSRVRESLKNYRYRHYRKVEYLINDQGRWHA